MPKWFNTAGPCQADIHYMLPSTGRLPEIVNLIAQRNYFVIHAPRQVGKTTAMLSLAQELTANGHYTAVMLSLEVGAAFSDDLGAAELAILGEWKQSIRFRLPKELQPQEWEDAEAGARIGTTLSRWAELSSRPLVVFLDEIDALSNETLISVLRQIRSGFPNRPQGFPQSVALVGMRDVRDYKYASGGSVGTSPAVGTRLDTSSPFNIKVRSFTLSNFTLEDVKNLYQQHTDVTGQVFTPEAVDLAFHLTQGQPWLVNAIAKEIVEYITKDPAIPVTPNLVNEAKEILIKRQDTHLDSLAERLREDGVRAVIQPILSGQELPDVPQDDIRYVLDLGLCTNDNGLAIANPIYQEVIPRVLTYVTTASIGYLQPVWLSKQGEFLPDRLLEAFLLFWRQHGEPLFNSTPYPEIAPHIVLMAFLHRVVNGGGTLEREYAIGSGRMDICLRYGKVTLAMELKVWADKRPDPLKDGLPQIDKYLSGLSLDTGWLVIFDRRKGLPPLSDRTTTETVISPAGREIIVIRG